MIEYPPEFPAAPRAQVERTIAEEELYFAQYLGRFGGPSSESVVTFVLVIFERFVWELTELVVHHKDQWTAQKLRASTQGFLDRLIAQAHADKRPCFSASPMPLAEFRVEVLEKLATFPFWTDLQNNIQALARTETQTTQASPAAAMMTPMSDLVSVQAAANHLGVSVVTVYRMQDKGRLPLVRVGHLRRVPKAALRQLQANQSRLKKPE